MEMWATIGFRAASLKPQAPAFLCSLSMGLKLILGGQRCIKLNIPLGGSRNTVRIGRALAKKEECLQWSDGFGACFTSLWVSLQRHQPLAYSRETCSPTVEEMNLLAATGSEVPDSLSKFPTFSSPGTNYRWNYTGTM